MCINYIDIEESAPKVNFSSVQ